MDKLLMKIQDTVMKYADIVSQIADVDCHQCINKHSENKADSFQ